MGVDTDWSFLAVFLLAVGLVTLVTIMNRFETIMGRMNRLSTIVMIATFAVMIANTVVLGNMTDTIMILVAGMLLTVVIIETPEARRQQQINRSVLEHDWDRIMKHDKLNRTSPSKSELDTFRDQMMERRAAHRRRCHEEPLTLDYCYTHEEQQHQKQHQK